MSRTTCQRLILGAATLLVASTAFAQVEIQLRPRQLPGFDHRSREGRCEIRVWVDNRAEVRMRGDGIFVRTLEGSKSHDDGSQCSQPIPLNSVSNFQVRQIAGRGHVTLAQEPSRMNNYTAMIAIEDRQGGGDNYGFEVTWRSEGGEANSAAPAPFFDEVRVCQDLVRQRFQTLNGRGSYIDFDNFADRQGVDQQGVNQHGVNQGLARNRGRGESIEGRGRARNREESRDLTYPCVVDQQQRQVVSSLYQFTGEGPRNNSRFHLR